MSTRIQPPPPRHPPKHDDDFIFMLRYRQRSRAEVSRELWRREGCPKPGPISKTRVDQIMQRALQKFRATWTELYGDEYGRTEDQT